MPAGAAIVQFLKESTWLAYVNFFPPSSLQNLPVADETCRLLFALNVPVSFPSSFFLPTLETLDEDLMAKRKVDTKVFGFLPSLSILQPKWQQNKLK